MRYVLPMFPYPSGSLHMGHLRVYSLADALARFHRPKLYALGWDAFGLPAENAARLHSQSPALWTSANINAMRKQLKAMDLAVDWSRELSTAHPSYYKHSQQLFLDLHKHGLVVQKEALVNWDPIDKTVLANEQVDATGRADRSGAIVQLKMLKQWFFTITKYAQTLQDDLNTLTEWPENVKTLQRNWIGRSAGLDIDFAVIDGHVDAPYIRAFTTRPEVLYDAVFLAVAPQHPILKGRQTRDIGVFPRDPLAGYQTDIVVLNPVTRKRMKVYVANYVLPNYASGAVMGVPGSSSLDQRFYYKVISSHSNPSEIPLGTTRRGVIANAVADGFGRRKVEYKLRDWLISRQRYWGTPIPMVHCKTCPDPVPVESKDLPVILPDLGGKDYTAENVAETIEEWKKTTCPK